MTQLRVGNPEGSVGRELGDLLPTLRETGCTRLFHCPSNEGRLATYDPTTDPPQRLPWRPQGRR